MGVNNPDAVGHHEASLERGTAAGEHPEEVPGRDGEDKPSRDERHLTWRNGHTRPEGSSQVKHGGARRLILANAAWSCKREMRALWVMVTLASRPPVAYRGRLSPPPGRTRYNPRWLARPLNRRVVPCAARATSPNRAATNATATTAGTRRLPSRTSSRGSSPSSGTSAAHSAEK